MRIVWVTGRSVWPPRGGSELRIAGLVAQASGRGHEITVLQPDPADPADAPPGVTAITVPRTWTGPAKVVGKLASSLPLHSPRIGMAGRRIVRDAFAAARPDVVVVSETHGWPLAADAIASYPFVFDTHNVEVRLMADMRHQAHGLQRLAFGVDERRLSRLEPILLRRATSVLAVSDEDARGLHSLCPTCGVDVVPSSVPEPAVHADPATAPPRILFVGQLDFPPNTNAVNELATNILPAVRASVPDAELRVVGRRPPSELSTLLAATAGASLVEDAPSLEPHYTSARLTALPIRVGSGSRLKVFEALSYGLPIVSTATGVAGIPLDPATDYVPAESTDDMVTAIVSLLTDRKRAAAIGAAGRGRFERSLTWSKAGDVLEAVLQRSVVGRQR